MRLNKRHLLVLKLHDSGMRYKQISKRIKRSESRTRHIIWDSIWRRDHLRRNEFDTLRNAIVTCLSNHGIQTPEQARSKILSGKLFPNSHRMFGPKSFKELCKALGIDKSGANG